MLVESSENRSERVLPKGHIEPGEDPRITAVREVKEETGHWARIRNFLEDSRLGRDTNAPYVRWFVLDSVEEPTARRCEERKCFWFSLEDAIDKATFDDTKALLRRVDERFGSSTAKDEITN
jgi:8-oxo-dGTP pyrophosphatase MutT (NUDIX family)